ncbi:Patatin-like phospholipase domain-containing protein 7 [Ceratobasidium theobromae]|uniref:Patatin-like phospholipase domain-containing protein 7 n=1 Tax=Ceratobasidium theobromae TaxID=1582974 RepID=A0A5N5QCA2_9AGAM|nr:Patatin-like phospholipase domain-containing protein 7 [Ceratobasidium theobromae]
MLPHRRLGAGDTARCPCGASQERLRHFWLKHTATCQSWIKENTHLFSPAAPPLSSHSDETLISPKPVGFTEGNPAIYASDGRPDCTANTAIGTQELGTGPDDEANSREALAQSPEQASAPSPNKVTQHIRRPHPIADILPVGLEASTSNNPDPQGNLDGKRRIRLLVWYTTVENIFGVYQKFLHPPQIHQLEVPRSAQLLRKNEHEYLDNDQYASAIQNIIFPFPNISTFRLAHWFFTGGLQKSLSEHNQLIQNILLAPDFSPKDFQDQNMHALDRALDQLDAKPLGDPAGIHMGNGWKSKDIFISIPRSHVGSRRQVPLTSSDSYDEFGHQVRIQGFRYRSLVDVIISRFMSPTARPDSFQYVPYRKFWRPRADGPEERIYDEIYTTDAWLEEHEALQRLPPIEGCTLERVIGAIMFASDPTHVAQIGHTTLWPVYRTFGNLSKYERSRSSSHLMEHIAYMVKLSGPVKSEIQRLIGNRAISDALAPHIKREIFHACWKEILDDEFVVAYKTGIKILCSDGVERRIFPCIFTYSADYQEKVSVALIQDFGEKPAVLNLVSKEDIYKLGTTSDRRTRLEKPHLDNESTCSLVIQACRKIYLEGYVVNSQHVNALLKPTSSVPTIVSSQASSYTGCLCQIYCMNASLELGNHSFFILSACLTHEEQQQWQFRQILSFPPDIIRHFNHDVSEMKRLTARDYEDILQCCIPCFKGLFPQEHDLDIAVVIFTMAQWHALAKLWMHTASTVAALDAHTTRLGRRMRHFQQSTATAFHTLETNYELEARRRRLQRVSLVSGGTKPIPTLQRKPKTLSLNTFKFHAAGDYHTIIPILGTTDNWSTQNAELEHRRAKSYARRTNQVNLTQGVTTLERREAHLQARYDALQQLDANPALQELRICSQTITKEATSGTTHYTIGIRGKTIRFVDFFHEHKKDPAVKNFMHDLQDHVLDRLRNPNDVGIRDLLFTDTDRQTVSFISGAMHSHATLQINYTSYDIRRSHDTLNPGFKHHFIMTQNSDTDPDHPFWYAKVLGIYHIDIMAHRPLDHYYTPEYVPESSYRDAYGFLDPAVVIRACHLIPAFHFGRSNRSGPTSLASDDATEGDWSSYYVNRFIDRDMFMRYWGGGVGHGRNITDRSTSFSMDIDDSLAPNAELEEDDTIHAHREGQQSEASTPPGSDEGSDVDWAEEDFGSL